MALNWDLTKTYDHEELCNEEHWPVTHALIWMAMAVGLGTITEKNWKQFYARARFCEILNGTALRTQSEDGKLVDRPLTPQDVHKRIGLWTNVSTDSHAQFMRRQTKFWFSDRENDAQKAMEAENELAS